MPRADRSTIPVFRSSFDSPDDEYNTNLGVRPVVFDILAPDRETSILPDNLKMVLHVNPTSMAFSYEKVIGRIQTKGGYVEQHWGDGARSISFSMVTGGFMRLRTGLSNITGGGFDTGGTRRETIAYDKYLDMLALFHNNGSVYDTTGSIVFQGVLKVTFDGGIYLGWFSNFNVSESASKPYQFDLTAEFIVSHEVLRLRSYLTPTSNFVQPDFGSRSTPLSSGGVPETPRIPSPPDTAVVASEPARPTDPTYTRRRSGSGRSGSSSPPTEEPVVEVAEESVAPVPEPTSDVTESFGWSTPREFSGPGVSFGGPEPEPEPEDQGLSDEQIEEIADRIRRDIENLGQQLEEGSENLALETTRKSFGL